MRITFLNLKCMKVENCKCSDTLDRISGRNRLSFFEWCTSCTYTFTLSQCTAGFGCQLKGICKVTRSDPLEVLTFLVNWQHVSSIKTLFLKGISYNPTCNHHILFTVCDFGPFKISQLKNIGKH